MEEENSVFEDDNHSSLFSQNDNDGDCSLSKENTSITQALHEENILSLLPKSVNLFLKNTKSLPEGPTSIQSSENLNSCLHSSLADSLNKMPKSSQETPLPNQILEDTFSPINREGNHPRFTEALPFHYTRKKLTEFTPLSTTQFTGANSDVLEESCTRSLVASYKEKLNQSAKFPSISTFTQTSISIPGTKITLTKGNLSSPKNAVFPPSSEIDSEDDFNVSVSSEDSEQLLEETQDFEEDSHADSFNILFQEEKIEQPKTECDKLKLFVNSTSLPSKFIPFIERCGIQVRDIPSSSLKTHN